MNINEDMRESVGRISKVHQQVVALMQWRKLCPTLSIYVLGYMMNKWELASFQGRETTEKLLFATLANLRRTDRVRAVKQCLIGERRLEPPRRRKIERRIRPSNFIARDRAFVLQTIEELAGSAKALWFLMLRASLSEEETLTLLAILILDYQYALNVPAAVLRDDLTAVWDLCSERMRQQIAKN
jgi:hypothetical protein